ncbi:MAG: hypothetical protein IPF62_12275 [Bacteroidetes bacterium]|nr:hypothetical protein [Bacteroidota bacterium]
MNKYAVWSMLQDRNGNIWVGTRNTEAYTNLTEKHLPIIQNSKLDSQ